MLPFGWTLCMLMRPISSSNIVKHIVICSFLYYPKFDFINSGHLSKIHFLIFFLHKRRHSIFCFINLQLSHQNLSFPICLHYGVSTVYAIKIVFHRDEILCQLNAPCRVLCISLFIKCVYIYQKFLEPKGRLKGFPKSIKSITGVSLEGFPPVYK